jgi:hypothetical protein
LLTILDCIVLMIKYDISHILIKTLVNWSVQWIEYQMLLYWRFKVQGCMLKVKLRFDLTCESVITTVLTEQHSGIPVWWMW